MRKFRRIAVPTAMSLAILFAINHRLTAAPIETQDGKVFSPDSSDELHSAVHSCFTTTMTTPQTDAFLSTRENIRKSPRQNRDAEVLALRQTEDLLASDIEYYRIESDLKAIRQDYENTQEISPQENGMVSSLILTLEAIPALDISFGADFDEIDVLNEWYGGENDYEMRDQGVLLVKFRGIFKEKLIMDAYASHPDVKFVEAGYKPDKDTDITFDNPTVDTMGTRRYVFSQGSEMKKTRLKRNYQDLLNDDFPEDILTETICVSWEHRVFDVSVHGEVTHVSTNTTYN